MEQPTWKMLIRSSWFPNALLFLLLSWLIITDQGGCNSQPKENSRQIEVNTKKLSVIEAQLREVTKTLDQRTAMFNAWKAERDKKTNPGQAGKE